MKKLLNILLGWWLYLTNRNNELSEARLTHCKVCEHRLFFVCKKCGCPLAAKSRLREEDCPDGRWPNYYLWFDNNLKKPK